MTVVTLCDLVCTVEKQKKEQQTHEDFGGAKMFLNERACVFFLLDKDTDETLEKLMFLTSISPPYLNSHRSLSCYQLSSRYVRGERKSEYLCHTMPT